MNVVDICNRALAVIGHDRTITNISGTTAEEILCNRFYAAARDNILASFPWEFATKEATVSATGTSATWSVPATFVRMVSASDSAGNAVRAVRAGNSYTFYDNRSGSRNITVRYVSNENPTGSTLEAVMPHLVSEAVVYELAQMLFGPMVGNVQDDKGAALFESYTKLAGSKLEAAISSETAEKSFMGGRRGTSSDFKTNVANRALACLGIDSAISDFEKDTTPIAGRIRLLYPSARDFVLAANDWDFASVDATVSATGATITWNVPSGFVRMVSVRDSSGNAVRAVRAGNSYTLYNASGSTQTLTVRYVSNATNGFEESMPALFEDAVVYRLASLVSGDSAPSAKEGEQPKMPDFERMLQAAIAAENAEKSFMGGKRGPDAEIRTNLANRALACLGLENAITDFDTDPSPVAARIRLLYPTARDFVLSAHDWEFASVDATVSASGTTTSWTIPAGFIRMVSIRDANGNAVRAVRAGGSYTIYNVSGSTQAYTVRYVSNAIQNFETLLPPLFADAVVSRLAAIISGDQKIQTNNGEQPQPPDYERMLQTAIAADIAEKSFMGGKRGPDAEIRTNVANRALACLGIETAITDFDTDPSPIAARIRLLYPTARDFVLSAHDWEFASVDVQVTVSGTSATWTLAAGFVKLVSVRDEDGNVMRTSRAGKTITIYNTTGSSVTATVRYVSNAIQDFETSMPPLFAEAIVCRMAYQLAGERIQTEDGKAPRALPDFGTALSAAIAAEISERNFMGGSRSASDEKKTEIANRAIAKLGGQDTVSDFANDQTAIAARVRLLFPSALDRVIRIRDWDFAAVEKTIVLSGADESGYCRVTIPDDCMRVVRIMDEARHPLKTVRNRDFMMVEGDGIRATIRYVSKDFNLAEAPDDFIDLLSLDLASRLAPTVLGDAKAATSVQTLLRMQFGETDMKEANETAFGGDYRNPFIAARD